ncbi:alpha/beta hydrolase fold family protein [Burkholderia cenocepacia]|uniref:Alpha/beta hydrolase fold family protein n=1 Tax=Burkholderia cenocepacia TaxID=95486 RepID=A0AAN0RXJ4_9BURK|nr:alpha/beta hydrolase fold family protein [Burkholderia cenocepacia]
MTAAAIPLADGIRPAWRRLDEAERAREYSPSSKAPDFRAILSHYRARSGAALLHLPPPTLLRCGAEAAQRIVLFEPADGAADVLVVYFHGGYWQELSLDDSLFPAVDFIDRRVAYAAVGYTLAPHATLRQIVDQAANAVSALRRFTDAPRMSSPRIVIAGSSAGAHLAAMLLTLDWGARASSTPPFDGAILLSGIYDLRPLVGTYINEALQLDEREAFDLSPQYRPLRTQVPVTVCWGEHETDEFRRQSRNLVGRLARGGLLCSAGEIPGRNHFDLVFDLGAAGTLLDRRIAPLLGHDKR